MTEKNKAGVGRRGHTAARLDDPPLVHVLIAEATRRGHTLAALAEAMGVTYRHLTKLRRHENDISRTSGKVLRAAARYLGVPTGAVMCMAGVIGAQDVIHPSGGSLDEHIQDDLGRMRLDPYFAGLVPPALQDAQPSVQLFVILLYQELAPGHGASFPEYRWMKLIHQATLGNLEAQAELSSFSGDIGRQ